MANREKVFQGLECCANRNSCEEKCPYDKLGYSLDDCVPQLARDALALLKDDETQLIYRDEIIKAHEDEIERLNELLKEQEPIPCGEKIKAGDAVLDFYECGYCKNAIRKPWKYCPFCGKAVKWDAAD